jgi:hypothetical protein
MTNDKKLLEYKKVTVSYRFGMNTKLQTVHSDKFRTQFYN